MKTSTRALMLGMKRMRTIHQMKPADSRLTMATNLRGANKHWKGSKVIRESYKKVGTRFLPGAK
jgi:hypothetical protein